MSAATGERAGSETRFRQTATARQAGAPTPNPQRSALNRRSGSKAQICPSAEARKPVRFAFPGLALVKKCEVIVNFGEAQTARLHQH